MTTTIEKFKLDILYKKLLGVPTANQLEDPSTEGGSSKPGVFPNQIYAQTIPPTIVNPSSSLTGWTLTTYSFETRANTTYLSSGSTYFPAGTKKYTYDSNPYIVYYKNLVLTDTRSQNDKKSFYSLDSTNTNLLKYAIPKNFDISSLNSYNALAVYDCTGIQIASDSNTYPWTFDPDSGILSFYVNALSSAKSPPVMSFIRYEGTFGMPTGAVSQTAASTTFTGATASTSTTTGTIILNGTSAGIGVAGNINAGGNIAATSFNATSDYRIKDNVLPLTNTFIVDNLRPVHYYNKISKGNDIGLIAHELQEHYPNLVSGEKDGENYQSVNYIGLIPILINEIQTMKKEIKKLREELDELHQST